MTRLLFDKFAKDYLDRFLGPYGEFIAAREIISEVLEIDGWFIPNPEKLAELHRDLGLLGRMAANRSLFESFRNPVTVDEIRSCRLKLLVAITEAKREAARNENNLSEDDLQILWLLTPTASERILSGFGATADADWLPGMYFLPAYGRTAIVVIHQLPRTQETLWLRLLGRGGVQKQAIDELESLSPDNPLRSTALELLYNLQKNLRLRQNLESSDLELVMRLEPLYEQDRKKTLSEGIQQGIQQGRRAMIEDLLVVRFGELDEEITGIIEALLALPSGELVPLLLTLSREELLQRFGQPD